MTLAAPDLVVEVSGDTAVDAGQWRHPVRVHRIRADLDPQHVPLLDEGSTATP